jgi:formate dehydrogenase iron-sulfur subunit
VAVGLEPACVKTCPTGAIVFGTKMDMTRHADERVSDLKNRGFAKAGIYDPQGVGGTHVIYVLQHADKPEVYCGLPSNPAIGPMVDLWKGAAKPVASFGLAMVALGAFCHYVTKGPNEVSAEIEKEFADEK